MEVSLSHDLEEYVTACVESGEFATPDDVIVKALQLWKSERERVLAMIQEGIDAADRGEVVDGPTLMESLRVRFGVPAENMAEAA